MSISKGRDGTVVPDIEIQLHLVVVDNLYTALVYVGSEGNTHGTISLDRALVRTKALGLNGSRKGFREGNGRDKR